MIQDPDALAAFGVLRQLSGPHLDPSKIDKRLVEKVRRQLARGTARIALDPDSAKSSGVSDEAVKLLAQAWRRGAKDFEGTGQRRALRLQIDALDPAAADRIRKYLAKAKGVDSVAIVDRTVAGSGRWSWPVRVTALGAEVRTAVDSYYHQNLLQVGESKNRRADLLIAADSTVLKAFGKSKKDVGFLLVFVDSASQIQAAREGKADLPVLYRALGMVRRPKDVQGFLASFFDELAHDQPPDVALAHAAAEELDYVVVGDARFLDRARASLASADLERRIEMAFNKRAIDLLDFSDAIRSIQSLPPPNPLRWDQEGRAASESVQASAPTRSMLEPTPGDDRSAPRGTSVGSDTAADTAGTESASDTGSARHLQAQVYAEVAGAWTQRKRSFEPDAKHRLDVRIGPTELDWIQVPESFPDRELPKDEARLTVHLLAPSVLDHALQREIYLRESGSSTVARFDFPVPAQLAALDATIIVYHKGKHLQSAVLEGIVAKGDPAGKELHFRCGARSQADLEHQRDADLTIWKNGDELVFTIYDREAAEDEPSNREIKPSLAGIGKVVDGIRTELFAAAGKLEQLEGSIEDDGLETIRNLAEQGEYLRRVVFGTEATDAIESVQFVSPYSSDSFPVEFLYDYDLPDEDAALCPSFRKSAELGCHDCSAKKDGARFVCPSGFWGLKRVIERQVRPEDASCRQPESSDADPGPLAVEGIVFAAADEVNEGDPQRIQNTIAGLGKIAPVHSAGTWSDWKNSIRNHYPALLIALPHNVESVPFQKLRIAAKEDLAFNRIRRDYVVPKEVERGSPVLLFACNSANAPVAYEDFVKQLRCAGAPWVVATVTYVLGPQAARVAQEFAGQLWSHKGLSTVGDLLLRVRDRMVKQDNLMALALVAYGDADWRI